MYCGYIFIFKNCCTYFGINVQYAEQVWYKLSWAPCIKSVITDHKKATKNDKNTLKHKVVGYTVRYVNETELCISYHFSHITYNFQIWKCFDQNDTHYYQTFVEKYISLEYLFILLCEGVQCVCWWSFPFSFFVVCKLCC